jgi:hypothetical protein
MSRLAASNNLCGALRPLLRRTSRSSFWQPGQPRRHGEESISPPSLVAVMGSLRTGACWRLSAPYCEGRHNTPSGILPTTPETPYRPCKHVDADRRHDNRYSDSHIASSEMAAVTAPPRNHGTASLLFSIGLGDGSAHPIQHRLRAREPAIDRVLQRVIHLRRGGDEMRVGF